MRELTLLLQYHSLSIALELQYWICVMDLCAVKLWNSSSSADIVTSVGVT